VGYGEQPAINAVCLVLRMLFVVSYLIHIRRCVTDDVCLWLKSARDGGVVIVGRAV